ncbi:MAG: HD domain-containing protein [Nitrosarchaeum sp.]|nr:HD domain-containing protein [Nitrosarchaeum sp.]
MFEGLKDGDTISAVVVIKSIAKKTARNGNDYLRLTLNDGVNDVSGFIWDTAEIDSKEGDVVKVKGTLGSFNNKPKLDITTVKKTDEVLKLPTLTAKEKDVWQDRFQKILELISDNDYNDLLKAVFRPALKQAFFTAPAARNNHQAFLGGLLQHSVEVAEAAYAMYNLDSKNINLSLLLTGAILHDIGKIKEYEYTKKIDRTTIGRLIGHTSIGIMILSRLLPEDCPAKKSMELFHIILSHHGKRDWGAPVEPMTKEAVIVHNCDMLSCYNGRFDLMKEAVKDAEWSEFDATFARQWYLHTTI